MLSHIISKRLQPNILREKYCTFPAENITGTLHGNILRAKHVYWGKASGKK